MTGPVCPECRTGKHGNCDSTAWDNERDLPVQCECWKWNHTETEGAGMTYHALLVKTDGLLEILHSHIPIDMKAYLEEKAEGTYVALNLTVGEEPESGKVEFLAQDTGQLNPRAREILASLTGVHVILTGTVAFTGLSADHLFKVVEAVG